MTDSWIITPTGKRFWPLHPRSEDVCIEDIAHALAHKCRFTGHTRQFFSVAQHSVIVAMWSQDKLWGLLHDAAEAYLADIASPIKPYIKGFCDLEENVLEAIADRFGLQMPIPLAVKAIDRRVMATEVRDLMPHSRWGWPQINGTIPLDMTIRPLPPPAAKAVFLECFEDYTKCTTRATQRLTPC